MPRPATPRTATTKWKQLRRRIIADAHARHLPCHLCSGRLGPIDYEDHSRGPLAAEVDHVNPAARGGTDDEHNLAVAHSICNQKAGSKGKSVTPNARSPRHAYPIFNMLAPRHITHVENLPGGITVTHYNNGATVTNLIDW